MSGHKATPGARGSTRSCRGAGRGACGTGSSAGRAGSELSGGGHGPGCSLQPRAPSPPGNTLHGTNKMAGWGGARVTGGGDPRLQSTPSRGLGPQSAPQPGEPCTAMSARATGWAWASHPGAAPSSLHHLQVFPRRQPLPAQPWRVPVPHTRPAYPRRWMGGSQRAGFQGWRAVTSEPPEMSSGWPQPPSVPSWFPTSDTWGLRPPCPASATRRDSDPMQRMCLKLSRELRAGARSSPGGRLVLVSMHTRTRLPGCVAAEQGPPSPPQGPAS